ncbi:glycosyltransferase family 2 protein [Candidatus Uhrbacteria bacterium]|nr:glycosyltransferase family 2 protein [Candidatus Uhrbacteria bacterium]
MMAPHPNLVISLVTWNSARDLPACLAAIQAQTFQNFQLVIVDNASTDGTQQLATSNWQRAFHSAIAGSQRPEARGVHVIQNAVNRGYAGAHNQAIRWAREHGAEFVLVLNPDVVLAPDAIASMIGAMEQHPRAASIGIPLLRSDGTIDSLGLAIGWGGRFYERGVGEEYKVAPRQGSGTTNEQVLGISGACAMYRLAALEDVAYDTATGRQYFDERFFAYKEDIDLALRFRVRKWEAWLTHRSHAQHGRAVADASRGVVALQYRGRAQRSPQRSYLSYRNHLYILKKHWRSIPASSITIILYELGKVVYALIREPRLLKAWKEFINFRVS